MLRNLKLQTRFTLFILMVTLPLLIGALVIVSSRADVLIEEQANRTLRDANNNIATDVNTWLEQQFRALQQTASLADVVSMSPIRQKNALIAMERVHPNLYLVHTMDMSGFNVARSDDAELKDYSDREYYKSVMSGEPVAYQVVIGKTSGKPALVLAVPILDENSNITGVASSAGLLDNISQDVTSTVLGQTGVVFIVDATNQIIAHTNPAYTTDELRDFSQYPPITALREGRNGLVTFTDENNVNWRAYVSKIDNGWGIVAQQTESELLAPVRSFSFISVVIVAIGAVFLVVLSFDIIQRLLKPIKSVTEVAIAISEGELNRVVEIDRQDEIGALATAFNKMTIQVRELVDGLEDRVADRTKALTTAAEVTKRLSAVTDPRQLATEVVEQVQRAFDYYYAQIYLFDKTGENLVLTSGTGEAGAAMMKRRHSLPKGRGLVGRAAASNQPVLVSDTSRDPDWLPNDLLPDTRAEAAIPIAIGEQVLGVLDVQHSVVNGLTADNVTLLESLAGQVAISLRNARSYEQSRSQVEMESLANVIGQKIQRATTMEETLQTAIRELGTAIGARRVKAKLGSAIPVVEAESISHSGNGTGGNSDHEIA